MKFLDYLAAVVFIALIVMLAFVIPAWLEAGLI